MSFESNTLYLYEDLKPITNSLITENSVITRIKFNKSFGLNFILKDNVVD